MVGRLLPVHGEQDFLFFALRGVAPHDEGSVLPAEAETRREGRMHRLLAGAVRHVIQVAARVGVRLVDCRRQHTLMKRQRQRGRLDGAGGANQVADHRLD